MIRLYRKAFIRKGCDFAEQGRLQTQTVVCILVKSIDKTICMVFLLLASCNPCENEIKKINKIDNEMDIVVFARGCGATANFSTHISVMESEINDLDGVGNVAIIDGLCDFDFEITEKNIEVIKKCDESHYFKKKTKFKNLLIEWR